MRRPCLSMNETFSLLWPLASALLALVSGRLAGIGFYFHLALIYAGITAAFSLWNLEGRLCERCGNGYRGPGRWAPLPCTLFNLLLLCSLSYMYLKVSADPWRADAPWTSGLFLWLLPLCQFALLTLRPGRPVEARALRFCLIGSIAAAAAGALWQWRMINSFGLLNLLWGLAWLWFAAQWTASAAAMTLTRLRGGEPYDFSPHLSPKRAFSTALVGERAGLDSHSLWVLSFLRNAVPTALCGAFLLGWYATSFIEVGPGETAALYRMGKLQTPLLGPGLHLGWPWPFDRVVKVRTGSVQVTPLGYESNGSPDFLWARSHANSEFGLPLGGGSELVAANLKLLWHVNDAGVFLRSHKNPAAELEALATRQLWQIVSRYSLDKLLSTGRGTLADDLTAALRSDPALAQMGVSLDGVVLESLHPPLAVAPAYQEVVSAEVRRRSRVLQAEGERAAGTLLAQADAQSLIDGSTGENSLRLADAQGAALEFQAAADSEKSFGNAAGYRLTRKMNTLESSLPGRKIYVLGEGVQPDRLVITSRGAEPLSPDWVTGTDPTGPAQNGEPQTSEITSDLPNPAGTDGADKTPESDTPALSGDREKTDGPLNKATEENQSAATPLLPEINFDEGAGQ